MSNRGPAFGAVVGDNFPTLQMIGVASGEKLAGVVTTHQIACFWTHWSGGRTLGHVNGVCPGCEAKISFDFQAYCGIYSDRTRNHKILRLTLGATRQIMDALGTLNNVRGLMLTVSRPKGKTTGRLIAQTGMIYSDRQHLPQPFNVVDHLVRIWGVEYMHTVAKLNNVDLDPLRPFDSAVTKFFGGGGAEGALPGVGGSGAEIDGQQHIPGTA